MGQGLVRRDKTEVDIHKLPEDFVSRRETLEMRAIPNPRKPVLPPQIEAQLAELEEKTAQCYIEAEEITYRLHRLTQRIQGSVPRSLPRGTNGPSTGSHS